MTSPHPSPEPAGRPVVAIVPAWNRADSVAATVEALSRLEAVDTVLVVDDGSTDRTADAALAAGASVLRLPANVGKGGAVAAAVAAAPAAGVYLLVDADVAATAAAADRLLAPVLAGEADMTIAVLPGAGRRGGFGLVRRLAGGAVRRATGWRPRAALSGQRAVRAELLRSLDLAPRFGLETALSIDARRAGARVLEVDVAMEHRHTGRTAAGFRHRAGQGADVVRAAWPRLTPPAGRVALTVAAAVAVVAAALWSGGRAEPASVAATEGAQRVVLFGVPGLTWDDVGPASTPSLHRLLGAGAAATTTVRTLSRYPSVAEGWSTLGAGTRVAATDQAGRAVGAAGGGVLVPGAAAEIRHNDGRSLSSRPGALGDALHAAGRRTAVVGDPAAALAVMDSTGAVDGGRVGDDLAADDLRGAVVEALAGADVVVVDPGELHRARAAGRDAPGWREAVRRTDALLGEVEALLPPGSLLLVVSVAPPGERWQLTPTVAAGAGVPAGSLHSPSTRRPGLITLTDVAPTVLRALAVPEPTGMIGHALRHRPAALDVRALEELNRDTTYRERIYVPLTMGYVALQAGAYLLAILLARMRWRWSGPLGRGLRVIVIGVAAYPLATFLFRAVPDVASLGRAAIAVLVAIDAAVVALALRARRHPLSPLSWVLGATVALLVLDVATGARLQVASLLGYSPHTAARFTGLGNTAFATLAASAVLLGALHVHHAPRRQEALVGTAVLFGAVTVVDGAPALGSDVGGILTLVPVFFLTLLLLSGRRLTPRAVLVAAAVTVVVLALATTVDLLRPEESRTHLGRLAGDIRSDGWGPFLDTATRKATTSLRTYRSPWAWAVPVATVYMVYALAVARGWRRLLPPRSAMRAGVSGALAAGLLGFAVNDSGVVITAVVFVYLGPLLVLLAAERDREPPVLLHGAGHAPAPAGPVAARA